MGIDLLANLGFYVPELIVVMTMCFLLFVEACYKHEEKARTMTFIISIIGLALTLVTLLLGADDKPLALFYNAVMIDSFSTFIKIILVIGTFGAIILSHQSKEIYTDLKSEFYALAFGVLLGGMLLASANNMLTVYLGIETLSILSYVLASFKRDEAKSTEAGMKYALYGGISAGIMLFGMSHIYGVLGSIQFAEITNKMSSLSTGQNVMLMVSFVFFFVGLGYKIACFPFHMWSPDVYQGSPIPVTSFFAIVPKMAGIAVLMRVSEVFFTQNTALSASWVGLLHIVAAMTMTVGNISAIGQDSVKRMLAYSSIGHAGFMLLGVLVMSDTGNSSILFYGTTYLFMTIVAFFITAMISDHMGSDSQASFKGLIYKHPWMAIMMAVVMFSLAGMPPFSGFVAKWNILSVTVSKKYYGLAFIAGINSVIALYYYMRIVKLMIFDSAESDEKISGFGFLNQLIIAGFTMPVIFLGIFWERLMAISHGAQIFVK
ncbi:MAG: NADH-quinone oxidoreductase subunit N [Bacteriovoracaceae bacterium]